LKRSEERGGGGEAAEATRPTRLPPAHRHHCSPSSTLRQLPRATMSPLLIYMSALPVGPPSSCRLRTPRRSAAALQPKPPCATTAPPAPCATTTIAATIAHGHQVCLPNTTNTTWEGGSSRGQSGLPGCPSRFIARWCRRLSGAAKRGYHTNRRSGVALLHEPPPLEPRGGKGRGGQGRWASQAALAPRASATSHSRRTVVARPLGTAAAPLRAHTVFGSGLRASKSGRYPAPTGQI
jgi:hypothetical protein